MGINPKTVAKWRKRATVEDKKTGPKEPQSTVLTEAEEAMIVAFDNNPAERALRPIGIGRKKRVSGGSALS